MNDIQKKYFNEMEIWKSIEDIPDIPFCDNNEEYEIFIVKNLIRCGAIPKKDLIIDKKYEGSCRNTSIAIWKGDHFEYVRSKFGCIYIDKINHFEDDDGHDLFIPWKEKGSD